MINTQQEKYRLYTFIKCVATVLIVVSHTTRMYTSFGVFAPANDSHALELLSNYLRTFLTPLFVFVSGGVYNCCIQAGKYSCRLSFLRLKAMRLLVPYFSFGLLYVAPVMCALGLAPSGYISYCLNNILLAQNPRHLWFLPVLFWVFLLAMVLRPLLCKVRLGWIIVAGISVLLFLCADLLPNYLQLGNAYRYQLYFFAGVLFDRFYPAITGLFRKLFPLFVSLPLFLIVGLSFNPTLVTSFGYRCARILLVVFWTWVLCSKRSAFLNSPVWNCLKKNAFGIYLFHPMIIYALFFLLGAFDIPPAVMFIGIFLVSFSLSLGASVLLRKLRLGILLGDSSKRLPAHKSSAQN